MYVGLRANVMMLLWAFTLATNYIELCVTHLFEKQK